MGSRQHTPHLKREGEVRDVFYRLVDASDPVALRNARRSIILLQADGLGLSAGQMEIAALWGKLTSQSREQAEEVSDVLHRLYAESWRKYHNLNHVKDCLNQLAEFNDNGGCGCSHQACDEIAAAIWFHDAIYDTRSGDNEHKSAELFNARSSQGMDPSVRSRIEGMILATKDHVARNDMEQVMLDIDLSILGRCAAEFDEYDAAIRAEYSWAPEDVYCQKRAHVLESFLDRERIFHTQHFFERFEEAARSNPSLALLSCQTFRFGSRVYDGVLDAFLEQQNVSTGTNLVIFTDFVSSLMLAFDRLYNGSYKEDM